MKDSWERVKLGDICISYAGGTPNRGKSQYYNGEIPWVSSGEVNKDFIIETNEHITEEGLKYSSAKWIPKDAILLAMYGATAGQVSKLKIKATSNQAVLALIPSEANDYFIYYTLKFIKSKILFLAQGSGQPNLSKSLIDNTLINLPTLPQQRKIAEILSTVDAVLEKTEAAIAKYQQLKQGLMHDVFTRGIDVHTGQLRPKQTQAPELYKQSALGWIPMEWEVVTIDEFGDIVTGSTPSTNNNQYYDGKYMFISPADIDESHLIKQTIKTITDLGMSISREIPQKSICVVCIGSTIGKIGLTIQTCSTNQQINSIVPFDIELSEYIFYSSKMFLTKQLNIEAGLQAVPIVNKSSFEKLKIPKTEKQEARAIANKLTAFDQKIHTEQQALAKYQQLKAGLMQDLLTGEVSV